MLVGSRRVHTALGGRGGRGDNGGVKRTRKCLAFGVLGALATVGFCACSSDDDGSPRGPSSGATADAADQADAAASDDDARSEDAGEVPDAAGSDAGPPPGKLFGFVGSGDGKIRSYEVDATAGTWRLLRETTAGGSPSFLAFDPSRARVMATDESNGQVRSFAFDSNTGELSPNNARPSGGAGPTHISLDPTGNWMMVANYTSGTASVYPVVSDGSIAAASDNPTSGPMSHWAGTNPSGTHVFVVSLGADLIRQYVLDRTTGKLAANGQATLPSGLGPRHLVFAPDERHAWSVNELGRSVTTFDFDRTTGRLTARQTISALPDGTSTSGVTGAEIAVHRSGKFVYASTRGYNAIATFRVADADGTLTRVDSAPTGGNRPRSFALDSEASLLFAGNESRNEVVGFRIDATTGVPTPLGKTVDVPSPTFVGLARFPVP